MFKRPSWSSSRQLPARCCLIVVVVYDWRHCCWRWASRTRCLGECDCQISLSLKTHQGALYLASHHPDHMLLSPSPICSVYHLSFYFAADRRQQCAVITTVSSFKSLSSLNRLTCSAHWWNLWQNYKVHSVFRELLSNPYGIVTHLRCVTISRPQTRNNQHWCAYKRIPWQNAVSFSIDHGGYDVYWL